MTSTLVLLVLTSAADGWGAPAVINHDDQPCVTYRAQLTGGHLAVEVKLEAGWHTFTMDNDKRAAVKLAGKKSLSSDKPTQLQPEGLEVTGPWMQSQPKDFSQPDLRIYSWGFEGSALFVAPAKLTAETSRVRIKGQACTQTVCKNVDAVAEVAVSKAPATAPSTAGLIAVQ